MKIAQLVSNHHSVPPVASGAIYHVVNRITEGLIDQGHDLTLFASGDSKTRADLIGFPETHTAAMGVDERMIKHYMHALASKCFSLAGEFDIIHSHFNLISSYYAPLISTPVVQTLHSNIKEELHPIMNGLRHGKNMYISFSYSQRRQFPELNWVANVYHGIDVSRFPRNLEPDDYLLFIGRITEDKGAHLAIEAAKAAGKRIVIAGASYQNETYWHEKIEPEIDGKTVQYIGELSHDDKVEYFRKAKALLFPIQWEEPFGLVMIESMACGTPVIGFDRGSVSEIVQNGVTGYVVKDVKGMVDAIGGIGKISRAECSDRVGRFFSFSKMVSGYERVYGRVIEDYGRANLR